MTYLAEVRATLRVLPPTASALQSSVTWQPIPAAGTERIWPSTYCDF